MCNLSEGVLRKGLTRGMAQGRAEGIAQCMAQGMTKGITKGILSSLQSLMKNMNLSAEQAMVILDIPEGERPNYLALLEKQS